MTYTKPRYGTRFTHVLHLAWRFLGGVQPNMPPSISLSGIYQNYLFNTVESFHPQMGFSFPFLRANDLRSSLLYIRARSFLLSCT